VIPALETILEGYYFVARRNGELARYVRHHVVAALGEATALAKDHEEDEPAALFYAFARRGRAFPPGARRLGNDSLISGPPRAASGLVGSTPVPPTFHWAAPLSDRQAISTLRLEWYARQMRESFHLG
jgi:hypothetical protein